MTIPDALFYLLVVNLVIGWTVGLYCFFQWSDTLKWWRITLKMLDGRPFTMQEETMIKRERGKQIK